MLQAFIDHPGYLAIAVLVLIVVFFGILKTSIKFSFKILINTLLGFVLLFVFNLIGKHIGILIPITWLNAIITGILGIPGVALLIILRWLGIF